jgi:hypothetical protein
VEIFFAIFVSNPRRLAIIQLEEENTMDNGNETIREQRQMPQLLVRTTSSNTNTDGSRSGIWKKLLSVTLLLSTLIIIGTATDFTILLQAIQHHEPSLRIFRSLLEIALLLICTSISIAIYIRYISYTMTEHLLFQSVCDHSSNTAVSDDEIDYDHVENNHNDDDDDDDDENDHRNYSPTVHIDQRTPESHGHVNDDDAIALLTANTKSETTLPKQNTSCHNHHGIPSPISIVLMALDLFVWILIAFILYILSAIHAVTLQQQQQQQSLLQSTAATLHSNRAADRTNMIYSNMARIAAPTFPLILMVFCCIRMIQFKKVYSQLYTVISYTLQAPLYDVTFRDGMIVRIHVDWFWLVHFPNMPILYSSHQQLVYPLFSTPMFLVSRGIY